jgi:hypothetical protein
MVKHGGWWAILSAGAILVAAFLFSQTVFVQRPTYGFTFSNMYAESLGLDAQTTYRAALEELHPSFVRIPVYWDRIALGPSVRDWSSVDTLLALSQEYHVPVVLAVGYKVPRYPECFAPDWTNAMDDDAFTQTLRAFVRETVLRYRHHPALWRWQVENEVFYPFGDCTRSTTKHLASEIADIRTQDSEHPIMITVSGEQQLWATQATAGDIVGTSVYRFARNTKVGAVVFPLTPLWYWLQAVSISPFAPTVISELQAEPWFEVAPLSLPPLQAAERFTAQDLLAADTFARRTGISEIAFWGVEWWYYLKIHGYPELWLTAQRLMRL